MASTTADRLGLLQEHIRQSLHDRTRTPESDADLARNLSTLHAGIEQLEKEQKQLEEQEETSSQTLREREDILIRLRTQHDDLHTLLTTPTPTPAPTSTPNPLPSATPLPHPSRRSPTADAAAREALMGSMETPQALRKTVRFSEADNTQILQLHQRVMEEQDEDLERLSTSIRNQREISIQIGDELESHVQLLDGVDELVDRHTDRLEGAKKRLGGVARGAKEHGSLVIIVVLILVLVVLIAVLK